MALVSPGDVGQERELANEVVDGINRHLAIPLGIFIELRQWEDFYPGLHPSGPQGQIDSQLNIPECDFVVGIFWKRLGTETAFGQTGAEHEIQMAYAAWVEKRKPQVMLYFSKQPFSPSTIEETRQAGTVLEFKEKFRDTGLRNDYDSPHMFGEHFRNHLTRLIAERVNRHGPTITVVPCFPSASPRYVRAEGMAELIAEAALLFTTSPAAKPFTCNVTVSLNTDITSTVAKDGLLADVFLSATDESGATTRFRARLTNGMAIFENVLIDLKGPVGARQYAIGGLRANALKLAVGSTKIEDTHVVAWIGVEASAGQLIHVVIPTINVGILKSGPIFHVSPNSGPTFSRAAGVNSSFAMRESGATPELSFRVRFEEPYFGTFTNAAEEARYKYATESKIPPTGIRFSVRFSDLPSHVRLYVSTRDMNSDDPAGPSAVLVRTGNLGAGTGEPIHADCLTSGALPLARIEVADGVANATWEWIRARSDHSVPLRRWSEFGVVVVAAPNQASLGRAMVVGCFAPIGRSYYHGMIQPTSGSDASVPRFANMRAPVPAFTVGE